MTIVMHGTKLINYAYVRTIDFHVVKTNHIVIHAHYANSEEFVTLGFYNDMETVKTVMRGIAEALENGAALYRMPPRKKEEKT